MPDLTDVLKPGIVLFSILVIGVFVVGTMAGFLAFGSGTIEDRSASPDPVTGQFVTYESGNGNVTEITNIVDSRGNAIRLTGADDSFVESDSTFDVASDETWTACTWANVASGAASSDMTALSVNGRALIQYNGSQSNWSVWYYDEGTRNSWRVNVSAPNQPGNFTQVCAWHNTTHLSVYRNNTQGDILNTSSGSSIVDANVNSSNWDGDLEETRLFDDALNNSQRQALNDAPVGPLANATRTGRLMYDEGSGTSTAIFFTSTSATISNGTWVTGLPGNDLTEGSDYELSQLATTDEKQIKALDGGLIDGAPVVWIDYKYDTAFVYKESEGITSGGVLDVTRMFVNLALVLIGGGILFYVYRFT